MTSEKTCKKHDLDLFLYNYKKIVTGCNVERTKKPNINYNNFSDIDMHLFIKKGMTRKNNKCMRI